MKFVYTLILLGLFSVTTLYADTVLLKSGKKVEGIVIDDGGSEIHIEMNGGTVSVKRNEIKEIIPSGETENLLTLARREESRGNFASAVRLYTQAYRNETDASSKQDIQQYKKRTLEKLVEEIGTHDVLTRGLADIEVIEEIKRYVSDAGLLSILQAARINLDKDVIQKNYDQAQSEIKREEYQKAIDHFLILYTNYPEHPLSKNLDRILSDLYIKLGEKSSSQGRNPSPIAYDAFKHVLEIDPTHSKALYYLGLLSFRDKNYEDTVRYLQQVQAMDLSSLEMNRLNQALARAQSSLTVPVVPTARPVLRPTPTPTPAPQGKEKVMGWLKDRWDGAKAIVSNPGSVLSNTDTIMQWLKGLGMVVGFVILFWYIPMTILIRDLPKRRVLYSNWKKIVNYTGILGLIAYFIDRLIREEKKKRCPACNRAIDNPELFDDYNFEKCPFCDTKIKPPFTLPEIIQAHCQTMVLTRSISANVHDEAQRQQMLNFVQLVLIHGRKIRASDIHIEPEEGNLLMRYRVDGVLTDSIPVDFSMHQFMVSCIKVVCNLNIAEKRLPQDGHFRKVLLGEEINVRVSTIPTRLGEKVVMRLLDRKIANASLDSLGMEEEALANYRVAIQAPHGLILATGPTGSGKTTLQYSSLQFINDGTKNIVTVEDPIEYELEGINQVQHNTATGLTFATALRSILRQDPDVIMIGEIRDLETGSIAVNSALTGHLVLSTVHTIDTSTALSRLIDIGIEVKLLSSAIIAIVAQRLVRKLCPHCKKPSTASAREIKKIGSEGASLEGKQIFRPKGCKECAGTGYIGRTGIYEMMIPNREIRSMIEEGKSGMMIREAARRNNMRTLREEGVMKILIGVTSLEEIIRVTTEDVFSEEMESSIKKEKPGEEV